MAGKYWPLTDLLAVAAKRGDVAVELPFADIAEVVGGLPNSAYGLRQWWANGSLVQAAAWRQAGWHVEQVNLDRQWVRFARGEVGAGAVRRLPPRQFATRLHDTTVPVGSQIIAANATVPDPIDVRVRFSWRGAGAVALDSSGRVAFARLPYCPGVFRMQLTARPGQARDRIYIGETDNLRRRLATEYRTPTLSQYTNLRVNAQLRKHLSAAGRIELAIAGQAWIELDGSRRELDLTRKPDRLLAENAAVVLAVLAEEGEIINLG
jgi:hypothetical protein